MTSDIQLTEWYLVRHAPVKNSRKGIYKDANAEAVLPAKETISALVAELPKNAEWYVSPMERTQSTANVLIKEGGLSPNKTNTSSEITEQDFGKWQGLSFEEIWEEMKDLEPHNWSLLAAETTPPEGESFSSVSDRVSGFIENLIKEGNSTPKVLVTHAGVIRAFAGIALGLDTNQALALNAEPFSLTRLLHQTGNGKGGQWQLQCLNRLY